MDQKRNDIIQFMDKKSCNIKKKSTILISSNDENTNESQIEKEELTLKHVYSVKNLKISSTHFDFDPNNIAAIASTRKQKKLQKNNEVLMRSLEALKEGAIAAIAAKQELIDELQAHQNNDHLQQSFRVIQQQVQQLYQQRNQLRSQIQEMEQKLMSQREAYERMLQQKQRIIEQLYAQLGSAQLEIENLQKSEVIKEKKIKIIEEENQTLFHQLEFEKITHLGQAMSTGVDSQEPQGMNDFLQLQQLQIQQEDSQDNSFHQKHSLSSIDGEKIKEIEQKHKQELHELALFYEKRLSQIRQLYQKQLKEYSCPKQSFQDIKFTPDEYPVSIKDTQVAPKKLSYQLIHFPKLSECYSITKRNLSKADSQSVFTTQRFNLESDSKLRTALTSNRVKFDINSPVREREEEYRDAKTSRIEVPNRIEVPDQIKIEVPGQINKIEDKVESSKIGSFLLGAVTGGAVAAALCRLLRI